MHLLARTYATPRHARLARAVPVLAVLLAAGCAGPWARRQTPEQQLAAAKQAFDRKDYGRARSRASRLIRRSPTSPIVPDARLVVIDSYIEQRNWPRAFDECENLLKAHPDTKHRTAVLRREFQIGEALCGAYTHVLFFRLSRIEEGVQALEKVVEHAPFGPLADKAVYAIGEAQFRRGDYQAARDAYSRLLKQYPNSDLVVRARVRRATCNQRLSEGPAYDLEPTQAARAEMQDLARMSGSTIAARYARDLGETMALGDYDSGLFYFNRYSIEGGVRYMRAVMARYPDSQYSERAERILTLVKRLVAEAKSEGLP